MRRAEHLRSLPASDMPGATFESTKPQPGTPRVDRALDRSVPEMFLRRVQATPDSEAFLHPDGDGWKTMTWRQTGDRVRAIACGLLDLGLLPEERCAILSSTRIEWILADLGILCAGGATTTIYPTSTADDCVFILRDCEAAFVFVEDAALLAKLERRRSEFPNVKHVILFDGAGGEDGRAILLAALESRGQAHDGAHPEEYEAKVHGIEPESLATVIYTSGTTGQPKGVELTHDCWLYEAEAIEAIRLLSPGDLQYFWLPLAHVFGKVLEAAQIRIGFTTAVDGRLDKLVENLKVIRPTFICAVPRVFEKVRSKIRGQAEKAGGVKHKIFLRALEIGKKVSKLLQEGKKPRGLLAVLTAAADALVFAKVRETFGGRLRFFVSGSAPLANDLAEFFHAFGILILEGYGLTESGAATFVNRPEAYRFGTVGLPLPGMEFRIARDGEIFVRGRGVMRRYHNRPEATAEALDRDGWLHTGDIGELDSDGFLRITDRKKDLIKTSGGKYIAPRALEGRLALLCPYADQVLVHGDNRKFCSALITFNTTEIRAWAQLSGLGQKSLSELAADERVRALIQSAVDELNAMLPSHALIKKFALLPVEFSVESGELTPSLKPKRHLIEQKYAPLLASFYESATRQDKQQSLS
jgi:long-chain acyl-CoA synthetase